MKTCAAEIGRQREKRNNKMIEHIIYCDRCGEMIDIQTGSTRQVRRKAKAERCFYSFGINHGLMYSCAD